MPLKDVRCVGGGGDIDSAVQVLTCDEYGDIQLDTHCHANNDDDSLVKPYYEYDLMNQLFGYNMSEHVTSTAK